MHKQQGFTLIELMVVLAILTILLMVAVPSFNDSLARRRLEGVANELSADLQYARTQAVGNNGSVSLVTSATGYTVSGASGGVNVTYKTIALDTGLSMTQPVTGTFSAFRGFAAAATSITVSNTQTSAQLQVSTDTMGRVQTCSPSGGLKGYPSC